MIACVCDWGPQSYRNFQNNFRGSVEPCNVSETTCYTNYCIQTNQQFNERNLSLNPSDYRRTLKGNKIIPIITAPTAGIFPFKGSSTMVVLREPFPEWFISLRRICYGQSNLLIWALKNFLKGFEIVCLCHQTTGHTKPEYHDKNCYHYSDESQTLEISLLSVWTTMAITGGKIKV